MKQVNQLVSVCLMVMAISGCEAMRVRQDACRQVQPYEAAVSIAAVHSVDGLPPPNTKAALKIGDAEPLTPPGTAWKPHCLDKPPRFNSDAVKASAPVRAAPVPVTTAPASTTP
jgi:hypothetical protein